jgi:phospholipid/cholesterol/gamma-HCH transport system substrate-binding protein
MMEPSLPPSPSAPPVAHLDLKARLLLLCVLLLLASAVAYVLFARGAFERTQNLVLVADNSEGVVVGMDLTFAGFAIGRVNRIELSPEGNARIIVKVPDKDAHWLRESSVFTMESGLVGAPKIRAYSGILTDPALPDGAVRKLLAGDAAAEIPKLMASVRDLVANLTALTASESPLSASLGNVQKLTDKLQGPRGALGMVFGDEKEAQKIITTLDRTNALLARLDGLALKADGLATTANGLAAKADAQVFGSNGVMTETRATVVQLNALLSEARNSLKKVDGVLQEAQAIASNTREASAELGTLRGEVEASLRKVEGLVNEINRKWPFKRDAEMKLP